MATRISKNFTLDELTAIGELLLFPTLLYAFRAIELGLRVKFQKGETSIEISKRKEDEDGDANQ